MCREGDEISGEVEAVRHCLHLSNGAAVIVLLQENLKLQLCKSFESAEYIIYKGCLCSELKEENFLKKKNDITFRKELAIFGSSCINKIRSGYSVSFI